MRREWVTAQELAGLPDMPATARSVNRMGDAGRLVRRPRPRGKGWEYHIDSLPPKAQARLLVESGEAATGGEADRRAGSREYDPEALARWAESRPAHLREEGRRRADLVWKVLALADRGIAVRDACDIVARETGCSAATLRRWYYGTDSQPGAKDFRRCDLELALIPRYQGRSADSRCSPEAWDYFLADYLRPEQPAAKACYRRLERAAEAQGWQIPSLRTLERRLEREIPRAAIILAREGREALERIYPAQRRDHGVFRALEAVNADGHTFDLFVRWPDGRIGRPVMVAWQDIYSGRVLSYRIGETESSDAYRLSCHDMLRDWGIPRHAYLDNGRGIASKMLTGGAATRYRWRVRAEDPVGLLTRLVGEDGIHWTTPYHGQAKPIERAFRDLCEDVAKHPRFAGAYTGNSPAAKPANYGSKSVPLADFLEVVSAEIAAHNARPGRRSRVCAGRSFDAVFRESYERHRHEIERPTASQLRQWWLAAEGVVADQRSGEIRLHGNRYWSEPLAALAGLPKAKRRVVVSYDPDDLHAGVHVYAMDGREIGHADCIQDTGFSDTDAARRHARERRRWTRAQRDALEAERRMKIDEAAALTAVDTPEDPPEPEDQVVRRAAFGRGRQVVGGDTAPDDAAQEDLERHRRQFDDVVLAAAERWRKDQI